MGQISLFLDILRFSGATTNRAIFSHAIRYEFADRNPITAVRQSGKRENNPVVLEIVELHRLFDELELRKRAMIVCDALTGMRRSELMGLQSLSVDAKVVQELLRHASFKTTMDGHTQALEAPKCQAQASFSGLDHAHG